MADVRILLISGSTRRGSGNTAALRTVQALAPDGITAELYDGLAALPAFSPDEDERPPGPAADLRARIAAADALLFCTPEYAGTLPGSLKNLLDWTVGGGEIYGKPRLGQRGGGRPRHGRRGAPRHGAQVRRRGRRRRGVRPRARPAGGGRAGRNHHRPGDPNGPRGRSQRPRRGSHPVRSVDAGPVLTGDRGRGRTRSTAARRSASCPSPRNAIPGSPATSWPRGSAIRRGGPGRGSPTCRRPSSAGSPARRLWWTSSAVRPPRP